MLLAFLANARRRIASTPFQFTLGAALCSLGLYHLSSVVADKREHLDVLNKAIDDGLARLDELRTELAAADVAAERYPAPDDVDPLRRIDLTFNGFEPVQGGTVAPGPVPEYSPEP